MNEMTALEIARRMMELGEIEGACQAYGLALGQVESLTPEQAMEAAMYNLQFGGDYRLSYDRFLALYGEGKFRGDCLALLTEAFYEPNGKKLKARYNQNCKLLGKYPYLFRRDFVPFEELPIRFYPYDDNGYCPFRMEEEQFGSYIDFKNPVISRNFFADLEKPVLAADVYSQYELGYLVDNVRKSEWVGRENHIYLHYTDWGTFCAHLQVLDFKPLLKEKKIVFLISDEVEQYPIDFKARFGIDYTQYPVKPLGIREVNRLIWHTQLSSHNGGDLFNEVFDAHPNLLYQSSFILEDLEELAKNVAAGLKQCRDLREAKVFLQSWNCPGLVEEFYQLRDRTEKDLLVFTFMKCTGDSAFLDKSSRIVPALFFQPHFYIINSGLEVFGGGQMMMTGKQLEQLQQSPFFRDFKYIKTFTPVRRFTTSYAASLRFAMGNGTKEGDKTNRMPDLLTHRMLNHSFMIDPKDRLFRDSIAVRFEDGKLNPKATFSALAAFLDLPYTDSMTRCTFNGVEDPRALGFNPIKVYQTYDDYINDSERYLIEYLLRDAYTHFGYDYQWYDGKEMDKEEMTALCDKCTTIEHYIRETNIQRFREDMADGTISGDGTPEERTEAELREARETRRKYMWILACNRKLVNQKGEPLKMMPLLEPDPALLEHPLYH